MSLPKIRIAWGANGQGTISINGFEVPAVRSIELRARAGDVTILRLDVLGDVEVDAEALLELAATKADT